MLEISEEMLPGDRLVIRLRGELDLAVASQLQAALEQASSLDQVVIGLDDCVFIDSSGIAVIVNDHIARQGDGRRVAVTGCADQVQRVLSVTGLTENGLVFENVEEALT